MSAVTSNSIWWYNSKRALHWRRKWYSLINIVSTFQMTFQKRKICKVLWRMCDMLSCQLSSSAFSKNINLYVSFLSYSPIKMVSQKKVILSSLSQNWPVGFSNSQFYDGRHRPSFCNAPTFTHSLSLSLSLLACFPFFPFVYKNNVSVHFELIMFWQ